MSSQSPTVHMLGISGSLRVGSFSTAILESLKKQSASKVDFRVMTLENIPFYNEDLDSEPALPAIVGLRTAVAESEAVVIATPEYNHGIPGVLKNALDWASRPAFESCFRGKPVLIISSSKAFTGGVRAQYQLRETLASMHAHVIPGPEVVIGGVHAKMADGRFTDAASVRFMDDALSRLRDSVLIRRKIAA